MEGDRRPTRCVERATRQTQIDRSIRRTHGFCSLVTSPPVIETPQQDAHGTRPEARGLHSTFNAIQNLSMRRPDQPSTVTIR
jgi:hypothetical protein